ncbi:MAG: hypothetical protein ACRCXT_12920 [Paraclostridium sp.]
MYYSPCRYSQIGSQPISGITNGCSSVSGIYKGTCDSKEHVIFTIQMDFIKSVKVE